MAKYNIRNKKAELLKAFEHYLPTGDKGKYLIEYFGNGIYHISTQDFKYANWYFVYQGEILRLYKTDINRHIRICEYRWLYENQENGPSYY